MERDINIGAGFLNDPPNRVTVWFFFHSSGAISTQRVYWPLNGQREGIPGIVKPYDGAPLTLQNGWGKWPTGWNGSRS